MRTSTRPYPAYCSGARRSQCQHRSTRWLAYTQDRFGKTARQRYEALLVAGLRGIAVDPERFGSIARPELGHSVRSFHLRHSRDDARTTHGRVHRPRHLLLYRVTHLDLIGVGRVGDE
jgi:toxin ParE1/3/4